MVEANGLKFNTSLGVLYALKEARKHTTFQETCASLGKGDIDNMLEVLRVSCSKEEKKDFTPEQFMEELSAHGIGFLKVSSIFREVTEALLYGGMSPEEVDASKKFVMERLNKK